VSRKKPYAEVTPEEQQTLYREIIQNEETTMLAQYIRENRKAGLKADRKTLSKFLNCAWAIFRLKSSIGYAT
jgi:hypothetical protein